MVSVLAKAYSESQSYSINVSSLSANSFIMGF
jgi:hypothetical protein